jgi:methionine-gamma-lyase
MGNAFKVAELLEAHPAVGWVSHPHLRSNPSYSNAERQMANGSGMMSFGLKWGFDGARALPAYLELITCAASLGNAEFLITHPTSLNRARKKSGQSQHSLWALEETIFASRSA